MGIISAAPTYTLALDALASSGHATQGQKRDDTSDGIVSQWSGSWNGAKGP